MKLSEEIYGIASGVKSVDYGYLYKRVKELEAQIPQWISVKDRLPDEKDVTVLLSYEGGYYELGARFDYGLDSFDSSAPMSEITHWLQLPEPPVSRKNEDGINILNERIQKLEAQIQQMKCCENCKHSEVRLDNQRYCINPDGYCAPEQWDRWELKE